MTAVTKRRVMTRRRRVAATTGPMTSWARRRNDDAMTRTACDDGENGGSGWRTETG